MKIKVISDGTIANTHLVAGDNNAFLDNVTAFEIRADARSGRVTAVVHLTDVAIDMVVDDARITI